MEIRRLGASDYDELLFVLNTSFAAVRSRPVDFLRGQPKMWGRDDLHMGKHIGLFEDGRLVSVVGIYPLNLRVGDITLRFATTGNVATLPEYAGRGYFSRLFSLAMEAAEHEGYDALRLGGQKQRYARFGFEDCGMLYRAQFSEKNRAAIPAADYSDITFSLLTESSVFELRYIRELTAAAPCFVERYETEGERDVLLVLRSKYGDAYIAKRAGRPIGYLCCADGGQAVTELRAENASDFRRIVAAWQKESGWSLSVPIAPWMQTELSDMSRVADCIDMISPSKFKLLRAERVIDAFLKLKNALSALPAGVLDLEIEGYGSLRLSVDVEGARCERVENASADLRLDTMTVLKLLFGPLQATAFARLPAYALAWFPLPLSWNFLDVV